MVFGDDDNILIKHLYQLMGYKATELMNKSSNKRWTKSSINRRRRGAVNRLTDSGGSRTKNVDVMLMYMYMLKEM